MQERQFADVTYEYSFQLLWKWAYRNRMRSLALPWRNFVSGGNFSLLREILGGDCRKFSTRRARKQVPYIVSEKYFAQIYTEQFGKSGARMSLTC